MTHKQRTCAQARSSVAITKHVEYMCILCVCVLWKVPSHKHIHCSYSAKDKNHPDLNKNIHIWTVSFIKPAYCAQAYLYTPISRACKVSFLLMLKHGPKQALILSQTLSTSLPQFLSIHLFPTIEVLPIAGNSCFLLPHIPAKCLCPFMFLPRVATLIPRNKRDDKYT